MNIYEKLLNIQKELVAPKNQFNKFGGYAYRSCEDILEALKPIVQKNKAVLTITDNVVNQDNRFYVEATAVLTDLEKPEDKIAVRAYAREAETKKGMDESQITGATSSYARKYALNGLFNIDDNKDADATNTGDEKPKVTTPKVVTPEKNIQPKGLITNEQIKTLEALLTPERMAKMLEYFKVKSVKELTSSNFAEAMALVKKDN